MESRTAPTLSTGALAKLAGVPIDTLRHYEREGLLPSPPRRASGYREYDAQAVERVRFIRRAKELGFTLDEIADLLAFASDREHGVEGVKRRASERLAGLEAQIAKLVAMRDQLAQLVKDCPGSGALECCPILKRMQGEREASAAPPAPEPAVALPATPAPAARGCCTGQRPQIADARA